MKKVIALLLTILLAVGMFVGCGSKTENEVADTGSAQEETSSEKPEEKTEEKTEEKVAQKEVEISFLVQETPNLTSAVWQKIIDLFEAENENIKVKLDLYPDKDREGYIKTLHAAAQLPDVFLEGHNDLTRIDALVEFDESYSSLLKDGVVNASLYDNKLYSMPLSQQVKFNMYYNKDVFEQYGIEEPTTWDEFLQICETLKNEGIVPIVGSGPDQLFGSGAMGMLMITNELEKYDSDWIAKMNNGELKWTDPVVSEIIERWAKLIDDGYFHEGSFEFTYPQTGDEFLKGNAAMVCDGIWFTATADKTEKDFEVGWFTLPGKDGLEYYNADPAGQLSIPKSSENIEAAQAFVKFMFTNKEAYLTYVQADGVFPTLKEEVSYEMGKTQLEVLDAIKGVEPLVPFNKRADTPIGFTKPFYQMFQNIFATSPVDVEIEKLEKQYRELLANQQ